MLLGGLDRKVSMEQGLCSQSLEHGGGEAVILNLIV